MYAIYAYIGVVWGVNVAIYGIHGAFGIGDDEGEVRGGTGTLDHRVKSFRHRSDDSIHPTRSSTNDEQRRTGQSGESTDPCQWSCSRSEAI